MGWCYITSVTDIKSLYQSLRWLVNQASDGSRYPELDELSALEKGILFIDKLRIIRVEDKKVFSLNVRYHSVSWYLIVLQKSNVSGQIGNRSYKRTSLTKNEIKADLESG